MEQQISTDSSIRHEALKQGVLPKAELDRLEQAWASADNDTDFGQYLIESKALPEATVNQLRRDVDASRNSALRSRFEIIAPHAQGGLGRVFRAADHELQRDVALKQLKRNFAANTEMRSRFMHEAKLTGCLEHPGIVPVYGLGLDADGVPYYAMRFIRGMSFRDAVKRHYENALTEKPGLVAISFRKLLSNFVTVCQTLHFAHTRNVLHRDIKPENIMLGEFGETIIVDWGIAKDLNRSDSNAGGEIPMARIGSDTVPATMPGSIVGTPGYMSPEQVLGWNESLGPRSDIYSLGATLFYLLTGRQPFSADSTVDDMLVSTAAGNVPRPRQLNPKIPRALAAICDKAMANKMVDRYASARELSNDVEAYLADEPVSAWREPIVARFARVMKRYRTTFAAAGLALVVIAGIATASAFLINNQRKIAVDARKKAETLADEKAELAVKEYNARIAADQRRAEADAAKQQTERVLEFLVGAFRSPDPLRDGRTVTVAEVLDEAAASLQEKLGDDPLQKASLLLAISETYLGLGIAREAISTAQQAFDLRKEKLGSEHLDTIEAQSQLGVSLGRDGHAQAALDNQKAVLAVRERVLGAIDLDTLITRNNVANCMAALGDVRPAIVQYEEILKQLLEQFGEVHHVSILVMGNLCQHYESVGRFDEAVAIGERAVAASKSLFGEASAETSRNIESLAGAYEEAGQTKKAIDLRLAALEQQRQELGESHPLTLASRLNLSSTYSRGKDTAEALKILAGSLEVISRDYGQDHFYYLVAMNKFANATAQSGKINEALPLHEKNLADCQRLLGPNHPQTLIALDNLAVTLNAVGRLGDAKERMRELFFVRLNQHGLDDRRTLTTLNNYAHLALSVRDLPNAHGLFELLLDGWGQIDAKPNFYSRLALEGLAHTLSEMRDIDQLRLVAERWIDATPGDTVDDRFRRARARVALGEALQAAGRADDAEKQVNEALQEFKTLGAEALINANAYCVLAAVYTRQGRFQESQQLFDEWYPILEKNIEKWPNYTWYRQAKACEFQRDLYLAWNKPEGAEHWAKELADVENWLNGK